MTIGLLTLDLAIPGARSLKDKRRVVKSFKDRAHNRFNCSIAEIDPSNQWGRVRIAVCVVGGESRFVNSQLDEIAAFAENHPGAQLVDLQMELL